MGAWKAGSSLHAPPGSRRRNRAQLWTLSPLARAEGGGLRFTEEAVQLARIKWGRYPPKASLLGCTGSLADGSVAPLRGM